MGGGGQPLSGKKINFSQENKIVPMSLNMIKAWYKKLWSHDPDPYLTLANMMHTK